MQRQGNVLQTQKKEANVMRKNKDQASLKRQMQGEKCERKCWKEIAMKQRNLKAEGVA